MQYHVILGFGLKQTSFLTGPKLWAFHFYGILASLVTNGTFRALWICGARVAVFVSGLLRAYSSPGNLPAPNGSVMGTAYI